MLKRWKRLRFYEILPGFLVWTTLCLSIFLSIVQPLLVIYFVIIFDLYWVFRVIYFIFNIVISWRNYHRDSKINWLEKLKELDKKWQEYYHLIFLPVSKEGEEIVFGAIENLLSADYPKDKMIVVLAGEERFKDQCGPILENAKTKYGPSFGHFLTVMHPANLSGEIPGKGSNLNYAGHVVLKYIDELQIPYEKIIVSAFDVDTIAHPQYFAYLTYKFLTVKDPLHASYQPIVLYNNNIWDAVMPVRITALGTTFWLMTELSRPERLFTFSSHSMPFKALVDVDFWQKDIVSEDSRIFLQCFFHYSGNYRVEPLFLPVSMDAVYGKNYWQSMVNLYRQQRRWAWGIENFPYMVEQFRRHPEISKTKKIKFLWNQLEGMYSWAMASLLILILGRLPFYLALEPVRISLFFQNAPIILEYLMRIAMAGLFLSAILTLYLLPPKPKNVSWLKRNFLIPLQWLFLPISLIIFGSFPAIDAQTRLMLNRPLGYNITEKARKN